MRLVLALGALLVAAAPALSFTLSGPARAVDGDTLKLGGQKVRLLSIDAPEARQTCAHGPCGATSTAYLAALLSRGPATCIGTDRDRYGRLLATCHVGVVEVNRAMVAAGHAVVFRRYSRAYLVEEAAARRAGRGIWADPSPQMPWDYRKTGGIASARAGAVDGCAIKGNISRDGTRIYHLPGSRDYTRTRISPDRGERWFCSEATARAAGWRRARG